jgi:hypothetical protein
VIPPINRSVGCFLLACSAVVSFIVSLKLFKMLRGWL